jgi:hypothetical protein
VEAVGERRKERAEDGRGIWLKRERGRGKERRSGDIGGTGKMGTTG